MSAHRYFLLCALAMAAGAILAAALPESRGPETPLSMASLLPVVAQ